MHRPGREVSDREMVMMRHKLIKTALGLILVAVVSAAVGLWWLGGILSAPAMQAIGPAPPDLGATDVEFSGLRGWFVRAAQDSPCVILMHGVRSNRRSMIERARFLRQAGYSSLLFDFQAEGESPGRAITFGCLESGNARAAVGYVRSEFHCRKIAVIGQSLGGAAVLLADPPLRVDALILESVYQTIEEAVSDRLQIRLGRLGAYLSPLLTLQLSPRLGIRAEDLRPIDKITSLHVPVFILAGTADRHTRIEESKRLFAAASDPKQFWAVAGAAHVDLHRYAGKEYERRVLQFLERYLHQNGTR